MKDSLTRAQNLVKAAKLLSEARASGSSLERVLAEDAYRYWYRAYTNPFDTQKTFS